MQLKHVPGVLVVTCKGPIPAEFDRILAGEGIAPMRQVRGVWLTSWGLSPEVPTADEPLLLSSTVRADSGPPPEAQISQWLESGDLGSLAQMLPPFAAIGLTPTGLRLVVDQMGFRQVFTCDSTTWSGVCTSARLLSLLHGGGLNPDGLLLQSQLGWQLADQTLFDGVHQLSAGHALHITGQGMTVESQPIDEPEPGSISLREAIAEASDLLRTFMLQYLEDTPEPTLQLTGGQDSRLLLSAIPRKRRAGLNVMTLDAPGTLDAKIAAQLAERYGMVHRVTDLAGLVALEPSDWITRVTSEAVWNDCMNDPLARAVTGWAEESQFQGDRLGGLGGEVARGFYYTGRVRPTPITHSRVETLARWRMLVNEPVEPSALKHGYARTALDAALGQIETALSQGGPEWYSATDELYFRHRMQRWAGQCESGITFRRRATNPMLDHRFLRIARSLAPKDKQDSRFLAGLQATLDEELASIPLDNRPPPLTYTKTGPLSRLRRARSTLEQTARKVLQRATNAKRPPAGATLAADGLGRYFRDTPSALEPVRELDLFDQSWLDGLTNGTTVPAPSSLALLANVMVATQPGREATVGGINAES